MAFSYLNDDSAELAQVLSKDVPWETYLTARLISDKDLQLIRRYDKRSDELRASMLDEAGSAYTEAFLSVLRNVTKEDTVQYVLALLLKMVQENPARARLFHLQSEQHLSGTPDPYTVLLRLLQRQDWSTQEKATKLLTVIIESRPKKSSAFANGVLASEASTSTAAAVYGTDPAEQHISVFIDWLVSQLKRSNHTVKSLTTVASALSALLKERGARALFLRAGGVQTLAPLLKANNLPANSQLLYELVLVVWQMTYLKGAAEALGQSGAVKALVEVLRTAQKEKVFRVALAALRNLLNYDDLALASDMVEAGLPKIVNTRQLQAWGDEDIVDSLGAIDEALKANITILSNFDKYKKEVLSGQLEWSPMHSSELFWRQNAEKFEEKDFQILRVLLKLIEASRESKTLAVGCYDLGQFIQHHPHGRYIVTDLRGKELVMRLMAHPDPDVQKQALMTVQRMMLSKDKLGFLTTSS